MPRALVAAALFFTMGLVGCDLYTQSLPPKTDAGPDTGPDAETDGGDAAGDGSLDGASDVAPD